MDGGGAIAVGGGTNTVKYCTFLHNSCPEYGGGGAIICGIGSALTATGSAFEGNSAQSGGAIYVDNTFNYVKYTPQFVDCTVTGNSAEDGGGLFSRAGLIGTGYTSYVVPGMLELDGCIISANSAGVYGGGLLNLGGMTLSDCTISGNAAKSGAGIADMTKLGTTTLYGYPVTATLDGCTLTTNSATDFGGGILNESTTGSLTLTACTVSGNSANQGGGLANLALSLVERGQNGNLYPVICESQATISSSTFAANTAATSGGGIFNQGNLALTGCTVSGNTANLSGGGMMNASLSFFYPQGGANFNTPAVTDMANSTLYGNTSLYGGGLDTEEADLTLTNDTLTANRTTDSGSVASALFSVSSYYNLGDILLNNTLIAGNLKGAGPSTVPGDVTAVVDSKSADNLIGDGDFLKGISNGSQGNQIGSASAGKIINADLGPLANNGGPTETVAVLKDSPAIDKGSNALAVNPATGQPLVWDQRRTGLRTRSTVRSTSGRSSTGRPTWSRRSWWRLPRRPALSRSRPPSA